MHLPFPEAWLTRQCRHAADVRARRAGGECVALVEDGRRDDEGWWDEVVLCYEGLCVENELPVRHANACFREGAQLTPNEGGVTENAAG